MYALFRMHDWAPSDYYKLGYGERRIVAAFVSQEIADIKEQQNG